MAHPFLRLNVRLRLVSRNIRDLRPCHAPYLPRRLVRARPKAERSSALKLRIWPCGLICLPGGDVEDLDLAEKRRKRGERGRRYRDADLDGRPRGNGFVGVEVVGIVEDARRVRDAYNGRDGGTEKRQIG